MPAPPASAIVETASLASAGGPAAALCPALELGLAQALRAERPDNAARLAALNLEPSDAVTAGEPLVVRAWVERATRTLAFVSADVFCGERRVATGGGVFELR